MQVRDGMSEVSVTVGPSHTLRRAAAAMVERNVGAALVIDDDAPTRGSSPSGTCCSRSGPARTPTSSRSPAT